MAISDGLSPAIGHSLFLEDNQSTIKLVRKGKSTCGSTRHIGLRYFFVHNKINNEEVQMECMPTKSMIADILTKSILGVLFLCLRDLLMLARTDRRTCGQNIKESV